MSHSESVTRSVQYLVNHLGIPLVSLLSEADETTVAAWINGAEEPNENALERLALATEIVKSLDRKGKPRRAREFFCSHKYYDEGISVGYAIRRMRGEAARHLRDKFIADHAKVYGKRAS